jgi:hypothetical protein
VCLKTTLKLCSLVAQGREQGNAYAQGAFLFVSIFDCIQGLTWAIE